MYYGIQRALLPSHGKWQKQIARRYLARKAGHQWRPRAESAVVLGGG